MTEPVSICSPAFKESLSSFCIVLDKSNHERPQSQVHKELHGIHFFPINKDQTKYQAWDKDLQKNQNTDQ